MSSTRLALLLLSVVVVPKAWSFPETIRHKYNNCSTCHISPTGGGLITDYGRALSLEVLSGAGGEEEAGFAYGKVKLPEWLKLGADYRSIQTYRDTPAFKEGRFFIMQADIQAALVTEKVTVLATAGREYIRTGPESNKSEFVSREHYVMIQPVEFAGFRVGRFRPAWGINNPEHFVSTRRGLGWDENSETYNAEASRIGETTNLFVTAIMGRLDKDDLDTDKGASVTGNVVLASRHKLGLSVFQGVRTEAETSRRIIAPWVISGITEQLYVMAEADYIQFYAKDDYSGDNRNGLAVYAKQGYEVKKGLNAYVLQDYSDSDLDEGDKDFEAFGAGLQYFPRPHLEFNVQFQKQKIAAISKDKWTDFGFFLAHFYL